MRPVGCLDHFIVIYCQNRLRKKVDAVLAGGFVLNRSRAAEDGHPS